MRILCAAVVVSLFAIGSSLRAQDFVPKGMMGVKMKVDEGKLLVIEVLKGSPAEKAGIKADDVLVKVGDKKVKEAADMEELQETIKSIVSKEPGTKIKLTFKRGDKDMTIEVTLGKPGEVLPKEKEDK
jgi:S1-C subfamily serine protease